MYGDYEGIILASFLTVISSYFAMWCILNNCLARKNVFKIAKSNGFFEDFVFANDETIRRGI